MGKHTPGPWQVYGDAGRFVVARPMPNHKPLICEVPDSEPETEQERANARLIAAAPELLEAAKRLRQSQIEYMEVRSGRGGPMYIASLADERGRRVGEAAAVLDSVIAKAEGR